MSEDQLLTQEEVLAQLRTRGFEEGFQATPLRDFWGVLESYTGVMRTPKNGGNPYLVIIRNFNNVEVIESTEPYASPIGQLEWPHSNRSKSKEGYWGQSIDAIINADLPPDVPADDPRVKNQDFLIGKMGRYKLMPGNMIWDGNQKKELPQECWKLVELRDAGAPAPTGGAVAAPPVPGADPRQKALELLNGKTEQQWHQAVFADPVVKTDSEVTSDIVSRKFLEPYMMASIVTKDDATGIYTVTQPG